MQEGAKGWHGTRYVYQPDPPSAQLFSPWPSFNCVNRRRSGWGYFNEQKAKATILQQQIDATDEQIDALVYELYGLTAEEVVVVEGK